MYKNTTKSIPDLRNTEFDLKIKKEYSTLIPHNRSIFWSGVKYRFIISCGELSNTHTYCRAFSNGAVITCFYDLGLSRLPFEHRTFRLRGQRSNLLRHRRGSTISITYKMHNFKKTIFLRLQHQKGL